MTAQLSSVSTTSWCRFVARSGDNQSLAAETPGTRWSPHERICATTGRLWATKAPRRRHPLVHSFDHDRWVSLRFAVGSGLSPPTLMNCPGGPIRILKRIAEALSEKAAKHATSPAGISATPRWRRLP